MSIVVSDCPLFFSFMHCVSLEKDRNTYRKKYFAYNFSAINKRKVSQGWYSNQFSNHICKPFYYMTRIEKILIYCLLL